MLRGLPAMIVAGLFLTMFVSMAAACTFDLDCEIGNKCVKRPGNLQGVCLGGLSRQQP